MMLEDLNLPWLELKDSASEVETENIRRVQVLAMANPKKKSEKPKKEKKEVKPVSEKPSEEEKKHSYRD